MPVPFFDLREQAAGIRDELRVAADRVIDSGIYALGPEVEAFEREFAVACGARYCVGVNSGTSAIHVALLSLGIGSGDEVITSPFTFVATVAAIRCSGARPVFADVDRETLLLDPDAVERRITSRTRAIVPVHLYGQPAPVARMLAIARASGVAVVEDAAQAHGATLEDHPVGAIGDVGCFSFYASKNLGALGEGGALVTNDHKVARTARSIRDWGQSRKYIHDGIGFNYRMDAIQGAFLRVKLRYLDEWVRARRRLASRYAARLPCGVTPIATREHVRHAYHLYVVRIPHRERVRALLEEAGIGTAIHYPTPVHLQPAYSDLGWGKGDLPVAEHAAREVLSLPLWPEMPDQWVDVVADELAQAVVGEGG